MTRTTTATPNRLILQPIEQIDPRTTLDEGALVAASRNAFPIVARTSTRRDGAGLAAGGAVALLLGGLTFWSMSGHRAAPPALVPAPAPRAPLPAPAPVMPAPLPTRSLMMPVTRPIGVPVVNPVHSPAMVFDTSTVPASATVAEAPTATVSPAKPQAHHGIAGGSNANDQFADRLDNGSVEVATAERLSDPSATVTQGTLIPAVLETAINTDLPGYVRALVSRDVLSFDGKRVLIPRSSRLIGQYKSGLSAGQTRAYVIWTRLIRPDGVSVELASPAVDFSGNTGLAGKVDSHFFKRFGSAALLSVVGGLSSLASTIGSSGSSVVIAGGGQGAASVAAQQDTQIPPTIKVPQGQPIRVFTAKDLDFSGVGAASANG